MGENSAFIHVAGGLGNMISSMIRGQFACRLSNLSGCCYWWRSKNPRLAEAHLESILDIAHLSVSTGLEITTMGNQEGWDFIHNPDIRIDPGWETDKYWCSVIAYSAVRNPNYFMIPSLMPLSKCRELDWGAAYRSIRPAADILASVDSLENQLFTGRVLGLHVRRTDRFREARVSTDEAYFNAVDRMAGDYDRIFLSTDDPAVEDTFSKRYGSMLVHTGKPRIIKWAGMRHRKTFVDIGFYRDAVVDMWLLSRCSRIVGSWKSSFSKVAARVSHNPDIKFSIAIR